MLTDWLYRLRGLLRRGTVECELEDELRFHIEQEAAKYVRTGEEPENAVRHARLALGGLEQTKEECRDARGTRFLDDLGQDLRYAIRALLHDPAFALVAGLSLALGIGANTAVFTVICGELYPVLTYPDTARLVKLVGVTGGANTPPPLSDTEIQFAASLPGVEDVTAVTGRAFHLTGGGVEPERVLGAGVSTNFFQILGVSPILGRGFLPGDAQLGAERVAIIKDSLWRSRFTASPAILGQRITLNGELHTVVGVVPSDLWLLPEASKVYVPALVDSSQSTRARNNYDWEGYAKLRPGVAPDTIRVETASRSSDFRRVGNGTRSLRAVPLGETVFVDREDTRQQLLLLQTAVAFVLLIACVNVGSLLLARTTARQHEFALRAALGAGRSRILRQLLTEGLLLAGLSGLGGLLLSIVATRVIADVWGWHQATSSDRRVLAFTTTIGLCTAILASLAPARHLLRHTDRTAPSEKGRNGTLSQTSRRTLNALLVCELSLVLGLLVGAGALIKSLSLRLQMTPGFATENLLLARTHLLGVRYAGREARADFIRRALDEIGALPGIRAASVVDPYPPAGEAGFPVVKAGRQVFSNSPPVVRHRSATSGYFRTIGITMTRGRDFDVRDVGSTPGKVIINDAMARRFWPGENPVGETITTTRAGQSVTLFVVGVVATRDSNLAYRPEPRPETVELTAVPSEAPWFMIRTDRDPMQLLPAIRGAVLRVDSNQPLAAIRTVEGWIGEHAAGHRSLAQFVSGFAVLALALVAIGIYGIVSYVVALRRREVAVRIALGAKPVSIVGLLLADAFRSLMVAIPFGLATSWALTRWMAALLYGVGPAEPSIVVTAAVCVGLAISLAAVRPAWRCTRTDPASVLRME